MSGKCFRMLIMTSLLFLSGCVTPPEKVYTQVQPQTALARNQTSMDEALVTNSASAVEMFSSLLGMASSPAPPVTASLLAPTSRPAEDSVPNAGTSQMQGKPTGQRRWPTLPGEAALQTADQLVFYKADLAGARSWYQQAAAAGNPIAKAVLAAALVQQSPMEAQRLAREALPNVRKLADRGYARAQMSLVFLYLYGLGVAKDETLAASWYRKAAEQGLALAQSSLGIMYLLSGFLVAKDDAARAQWFRKAAEQGVALAQIFLGDMYLKGRGVAKDDAAAVQWFRKAAEQGVALAQNNLGAMYGNGQGVAKDDAAAAQWFRKAAEQGAVVAQYNLGIMYKNGQGVAKDDAAAAQWLRKAAEQGDQEAKVALQRLETLQRQ